MIIYTPLAAAVLILQQPRLGLVELAFIGGSAILHIAYFLALQRGYRVGDLSLVYPLARGTDPVLSTAAVILFLGEPWEEGRRTDHPKVDSTVFAFCRTTMLLWRQDTPLGEQRLLNN